MLVLENREFGQVIGNPGAPFLNRLARRGALATRYFAISHPSLPNYLALLGGATFRIQSDCTGCSARGPSSASQLERAGVSGVPMEECRGPATAAAMPGATRRSTTRSCTSPSVRERSGELCSNVVPGFRFGRRSDGRAAGGVLWITPDLCHDGHDCATAAMDHYLADLVPRLISSLGPHGFLVVTFDEGVSERGCCAGAHGGRVATVFTGPDVRKHARLKRQCDHYSLLRALQKAFSLPPLRRSARVIGIPAAFTTAPSLR